MAFSNYLTHVFRFHQFPQAFFCHLKSDIRNVKVLLSWLNISRTSKKKNLFFFDLMKNYSKPVTASVCIPVSLSPWPWVELEFDSSIPDSAVPSLRRLLSQVFGTVPTALKTTRYGPVSYHFYTTNITQLQDLTFIWRKACAHGFLLQRWIRVEYIIRVIYYISYVLH